MIGLIFGLHAYWWPLIFGALLAPWFIGNDPGDENDDDGS